MAEVQIRGLEAVKRELSKLEPRLQKNILRGATMKVARDIRDDARLLVPKDTGNLRKNIVTKSLRGRPHSIRAAVVVRVQGKRAKLQASVFGLSLQAVKQNSAYYWRFIEYGTRFITARPFLRPAYDAMQGRVSQIMGQYVRGRLDRGLKR